MNKHKFQQLIFLVILQLATLVGGTMAAPRSDIRLNDQWKFIRQDAPGAAVTNFDDSMWQAVNLPHTWNNLDGQTSGTPYYRGIGWYRRHLQIDAPYADKSLFLKFDGAATVAEVLVNGTSVGTHKGNFAAFCFEVTPFLRVGQDNVIAVKVDNAKDSDVLPLSGDFTVFGGLYRDVHLLVLDKLSVTPLDYASSGVYIKQTDLTKDSAEFDITTKLRNANSSTKTAAVHCSIVNAKGKKIQQTNSHETLGSNAVVDVVQHIKIIKPHLWNGRIDPYLYTVTVEVRDGDKVTDSVTQPLGVRTFRVDPDHGFFLNGMSYPLHGVSRHQDRLDKGWAIGRAEQEEDFQLITEMGATCVRLAHYQQDQLVYDICDHNGLVLWTELSLVNELTDSDAFTENARQQLTEMIMQNYNHPSIAFWGIFNELHMKNQWYEAPAKWDIVKPLNQLAKDLDPTRLTTAASCIRSVDPLNAVTDVMCFNRYFGWYADKLSDWPGFLDKFHQEWPNRGIGISEYGAGASINQHEISTNQPGAFSHWHPEEYQNLAHEQAWLAMKDRSWLWCTLVWNMFDFAVGQRDEADVPGRNDKGLVTYDRKVKKDAFFWYKANWTTAPFVYITSRRFTNRSEPKTPVKIYSNCETVELKINGAKRGTVHSTNHIFLWNDMPLVPGENHIEASASEAGKKYTDFCSWTYKAGTEKP
jgi:beta-galactosidase